MLLIQTNVLVGPDRVVMLRLPGAVPAGRHRLTVILDEAPAARGMVDPVEVGDVIGYDYDEAQGKAFDAVYHVN